MLTRSATIGSTEAPRRAGMKHASAATATSTIDTGCKRAVWRQIPADSRQLSAGGGEVETSVN